MWTNAASGGRKVVASLDMVVGGLFVIISKSFINLVLLVEGEWTL